MDIGTIDKTWLKLNPDRTYDPAYWYAVRGVLVDRTGIPSDASEDAVLEAMAVVEERILGNLYTAREFRARASECLSGALALEGVAA